MPRPRREHESEGTQCSGAQRCQLVVLHAILRRCSELGPSMTAAMGADPVGGERFQMLLNGRKRVGRVSLLVPLLSR